LFSPPAPLPGKIPDLRLKREGIEVKGLAADTPLSKKSRNESELEKTVTFPETNIAFEN